MALGARPSIVLRLVLRQGFLLAVIGLAVGLAATFMLTHLLAGFVGGVSDASAGVFAGV